MTAPLDWSKMNNRSFRADNAKSVRRMKSIGIKYVSIIGAGHDNECELCRGCMRERIPIDEAPVVPPVGCKCKPYCMCLLIAVE